MKNTNNKLQRSTQDLWLSMKIERITMNTGTQPRNIKLCATEYVDNLCHVIG